MDTRLLERTRSMLRARVEAALKCPSRMFGHACGHLLSWLRQHPLLAPQLELLDKIASAASFEAKLLSSTSLEFRESMYPIPTSTTEEHAALALKALSLLAGKNCTEYGNQFTGIAYAVSGERELKIDGAVTRLRQVAVTGLYSFLDESIDGQFAVVALLKKYKHRSEWYRRARLRAIAQDRFEGQRAGEDSLMIDLYEYIHDQGVDFRIESWSASGRADLVADSAAGQRIVLDGKYVRQRHGPSAVTRLIAQGLRQVRDYCRDHNEPVGYLVTYLNKDLDVHIEDAPGTFPSVEIGGVTVVCVFINIFEYPQTASERPSPTVHTISRSDLVNATEAADVEAEIPEDT